MKHGECIDINQLGEVNYCYCLLVIFYQKISLLYGFLHPPVQNNDRELSIALYDGSINLRFHYPVDAESWDFNWLNDLKSVTTSLYDCEFLPFVREIMNQLFIRRIGTIRCEIESSFITKTDDDDDIILIR